MLRTIQVAEVVINLLDDEAVDCLVDETQAQVILKSGEVLYADKVVLAFGNFLPPHPKTADRSYTNSEKYFQNPWKADVYEKIAPTDDVFVVGTGLTFVDVAASLQQRRHAGKIYGFSTRGLLPAVHRLDFVYPQLNLSRRESFRQSNCKFSARAELRSDCVFNFD